ncbi:DUF2269 domain-containing protein [Micromonospora echinaurantiaca]|uniref:DUF2269 domain-containing protein n=1 Tax=Micromonospora echinaurantiaca TaxID=47857 RepID=UPI0037B56D1B
MRMRPLGRKVGLVAHVGCSVGWLGAVLTSLVLAVVGLSTRDAETARAAYILLEGVGWCALVPLGLASLLTGLVQALGTRWGLFRHYWVIAKFAMNLLAVGVLLLYTQTLAYLADRARASAYPADVDQMNGLSPVVHASAAVALLLTALLLSVLKPKGLTPYGQRKSASMPPRGGALRTRRVGILP